MTDKLPKQVCTVDPKDKSATIHITAGGSRDYQVGFRTSEPLTERSGFFPKPLLSALDQMFGTTFAKDQPLSKGMTGSFTADADVYIPKTNQFLPSPETPIEVNIHRWEGDQPKGSCNYGGDVSTSMPIVDDRRGAGQKGPEQPATVAPKFSI